MFHFSDNAGVADDTSMRQRRSNLDLTLVLTLVWGHMLLTHFTGGVNSAGTAAMVGVVGIIGVARLVALADEMRHRRLIRKAAISANTDAAGSAASTLDDETFMRKLPSAQDLTARIRTQRSATDAAPTTAEGPTAKVAPEEPAPIKTRPDSQPQRLEHSRLTTVAEYTARLDHMLMRKPSTTDVVAAIVIEATRTTDSNLTSEQAGALRSSIIDRLSASLDLADTVCVTATGRFMVLIEDAESKTALIDRARALGESLSRPHVLDDHSEPLTIRTAVAFADAQNRAADTLCLHARRALGLTEAGALEVYGGHVHTTHVDRSELRADLARALRDDQLDVVYQPVVTTSGGEIVGFEALMRWHHPQRGVISPGTFLPIAHELGITADMGRWLIDRAAAQLRTWDLAHPGVELTMSVNLSATELADPGLAAEITRICQRRSIDPRRFVLEISERSVTDDSAHALAVLASTGAKLALDDFGTGNRSLLDLEDLPFTMLKIDRAVVASLDGDDDHHVASSIVELGGLLGITLVAEGVERPAQAALLGHYGFALAQGHLYARPMSASAADALLDHASLQSWRVEAPAALIVD